MSFYTSLNGLKNAQLDLGTVAHNIANVETTGFKKSRVEFADIVAGSAYTNPKLIQGIGATVESISQNFSLGPIEQTGSALDLAINGDGFFTTVSAQTGQTLYTRNGSLVMDDAGFIHDGSNNRLQVFPTDVAGVVTSSTPQDAQVPAVNGAGADFAGTHGQRGRQCCRDILRRHQRGCRQGRARQLHFADRAEAGRLVELAGDRPVGHRQLWRAGRRPVRPAAVGRARTLERRYRRGAGQPDHRPAQFPGQRQGDRYRHPDLANHHQSAHLMDRLIYTAVSGMNASMLRQRMIASNMANAQTIGFRAETMQFTPMTLESQSLEVRAMNRGEVRGAQMRAGSLTQTGRELDIAMAGDALMAVQAPDGGEAYTRRGDLSVTATGVLQNGEGLPVIGENGPITLPLGSRAAVAPDGAVMVSNPETPDQPPAKIEQLKLVNWRGSKIEKDLTGLFRVPAGPEGFGVLPRDEDARVQTGALEQSNVNPSEVLVEMVEAQRLYDMRTKLVATAKELDEAGAGLMRLG